MDPNDFTDPRKKDTGGILKRPVEKPKARKIETEEPAPTKPKIDMEGIFETAANQKAELRSKMAKAVDKTRPEEEAVSKLNDQLSGGGKGGEIEKELEDMDTFSDEDLAMAEELLFNGFCQKDVKLTKKTYATFYSLNADEMELINQLMWDFTKKHENEDGLVDVSQKTVNAMNQLYFLSVTFKGFDGKDISSSKSTSLDILKSAFKKLGELEIEGDLDTYNKLTEEVKRVMRIRASYIKSRSATVIDVLGAKRFEFERVLFEILKRGDIYPK